MVRKRKQKHNRQAIYEWICVYKREHDGNSPSMREIGQAFEISSISLVDYILNELVDKGKIVRDGARGIQVVGGRWEVEI
jgi:SOS-response transcriptional repressor LexA